MKFHIRDKENKSQYAWYHGEVKQHRVKDGVHVYDILFEDDVLELDCPQAPRELRACCCENREKEKNREKD